MASNLPSAMYHVTGACKRAIQSGLRNDAAAQYIRRIKNSAKRDYACAYLDYLEGRADSEPDNGALTYGAKGSTYSNGLSFMAAQAVRSELGSILRHEGRYPF
jgi:hypothetical protein